jgi:hypothetical protein
MSFLQKFKYNDIELPITLRRWSGGSENHILRVNFLNIDTSPTTPE